jgi:hypothetical protein
MAEEFGKMKSCKGPFIFYQEGWADGFCGGATRKNSDVKGGHLRKIKF